ncbi:MAG: hypothetical protein SOI13_05240 [Bifidobacterium mongoliense]|uniref:hypothetical protein n=1 Tax=Bifidobacterium mongoliense TaxID=518643 RepID=UPI002F35C53E
MNAEVLASWAGAAVSLAGTAITVWWPWRNRPQASWFVQRFEATDEALYSRGLLDAQPHDGLGRPEFLLDVLNDGDGPAFDITVDSDACIIRILKVKTLSTGERVVEELPNAHSVKPGESFLAAVWNSAVKDNVVFSVHWTLQPTRYQSRVYHSFALKGDLERQPWKPIPEGSRDGSNLTWYLLSHSTVAKWSCRWFRSSVRSVREKVHQEDRY